VRGEAVFAIAGVKARSSHAANRPRRLKPFSAPGISYCETPYCTAGQSSAEMMTNVDTPQPRSFSDDAALIERIRAGETDAFLELIQPYGKSVYLLAYSVLKNQADAEDTAQETILKAFKYLHQLTAIEKFKSWLLQIAMNEARIRRRKNRGHLYESIDEGLETEESDDFMPRQFADWREIPSEVLERKEVREQLNKALYDLPDKYREIFLLRDVQRLDEEEAAEVLGISKAAAKARLHRARLQLREKLAPIFKKRWTDRLPFRKGVKPW
jgi:RNA polymerase sigma-70 factor, ECF subfamily